MTPLLSKRRNGKFHWLNSVRMRPLRRGGRNCLLLIILPQRTRIGQQKIGTRHADPWAAACPSPGSGLVQNGRQRL